MALLDLYSRRKRNAAKTGADVYQYEEMSPKLRNQLLFAFREMANAVGISEYEAPGWWTDVCDITKEELGTLQLGRHPQDSGHEFAQWFASFDEIDYLLDGIEIIIRLCQYEAGRRHDGSDERLSRIIAKINARMLEDKFGFQVEGGEVIQVSSQFAHAEVVVPALTLLKDERFPSANAEFRKAHQEYRAGSYNDCITDCGKALESVFKVIAKERGWPGVNDNSVLSKLIEAANQE